MGDPVSYHFLVTFFIAGVVPNPLDIGFKVVSGISSTVETMEVKEGGENLFMNHLPVRVTHDNVTLERGMVLGSLLNLEFMAAMESMEFAPSNILIMPLDQSELPLYGGWLLQHAYPVKWAVSNLDGDSNSLIIDTMELTYGHLQHMRV